VCDVKTGKIQKNLETDEDFKTPLQLKLDEFGQQLSKVQIHKFCDITN